MNIFTQLQKSFKPSFIETDLAPYYPVLQKIREKENVFKEWEDADIKEYSGELIKKAKCSIALDNLLVDTYALVSEVTFRTLSMRPYDVQIIAAIALHQGKVIEMQTGEGKTLTATMPAYLNAINGKGVHIHTFNDYLAKRDALWMQPVYHFLGVSVGYIQGEMSPDIRREVYKKDITYLTAKEGGFDYLRTFLSTDPKGIVQTKINFAIIDEVDSILIDEARIPLVIAGEVAQNQAINFYYVSRLVKQLIPGEDFQTDEYALNIFLTETGVSKVEKELDCIDLYAVENEELLVKINLSLQAQWLLKRDVDYIVRDDKIELVDEFTGRIVENRKWPHGLQAAIEAKESIPVQPEGKILGKTTLQHFFRTYPKLCGMTGTAQPAAEEFAVIYGMPVIVIPANKPSQRIDHPDFIFYNKEAKIAALIEEIKKEHSTGRPVLVGTASVEESEGIARILHQDQVYCQTLNAKNDAEEAVIIAKAGMLGTVTISTNMAGRGTDIKLGGEEATSRDKILALGGLYIIGMNRFESRRIDDQLRGRAGRQGDPGESRFFISLKDDLLQKHGIDELIPRRFRQNVSMSSVNHEIIKREVNRARRIIEGKNFDIRKTLWKYASFVEIQREIVHQRRQNVLYGNFESLLLIHDKEFYRGLVHQFGEVLVRKVESQITLAVIDMCWADYLEEIDQIRQSIYLIALGGMNPFIEFQRRADDIFSELLQKINQEIIQKIKTVHITQNGIDLEKEGLHGPTSTWTYLISDNPFGDKLEMMLNSSSQIGFAAFAALVWPLLAFYFTIKKAIRKKI